MPTAPAQVPPASEPQDRPGQPAPHGPTHVGKAPIAPASSPPEEGKDLQMPHERDEAAGQVAAQPNDVIAQAKKDLDAGLVDTDMRVTPGLDAERREALTGTAAPPQVDAPLADSRVGPGSQPKAPRTDRPASGRRR